MRPRHVLLLLAVLLAALAVPTLVQAGLAQEGASPVPSPASATAAPDHVAAGPVARGVFFFSPTCPHCEEVISEHLPGIYERFGGAGIIAIDETIAPSDVAFYLLSNGTLQLLVVDVSVDAGARMFVADSERLGLAEAGVPRIDIADQYLVGAADIPDGLPAIIEAGLAGEGIDWPPVPGLAEALEPFPTVGAVGDLDGTPGDTEALLPGARLSLIDRFSRDLLGNTIAVVVLVALLASLMAVPVLGLRGRLPVLPAWPIPVLAIIGIGVSAYLGSVETSGAEAVCGPVGDCNAVQESEYARLFGVPIGVLGVVGYSLILAGWLMARLLEVRMADLVRTGIAAGAFAGTLFSAYLTFLEPFVIGATCMWCIASALTMLALLWLLADPGWAALDRLRATPARA